MATKLQTRITTQKSKLVSELARAAKIDEDAADRVLKVLRVEKLMEQMNTHEKLSADIKVMEALNIHKGDIATYRKDFTIEKLSLTNLRLGVLSPNISGSSILV